MAGDSRRSGEERDRLLEPAGNLVVDPEVGHDHLRIRVLAAELGLLSPERLFEQRHGLIEFFRLTNFFKR